MAMVESRSFVALVPSSAALLVSAALLFSSPAFAQTACGAANAPTCDGACPKAGDVCTADPEGLFCSCRSKPPCRCDQGGEAGDIDRLIITAMEAESAALGLLYNPRNDRKSLMMIAKRYSRVVRRAVRMNSAVQRIFIRAASYDIDERVLGKAAVFQDALQVRLDRATKAVDRAKAAARITSNAALVLSALGTRLRFDMDGFGFTEDPKPSTCGSTAPECNGTCPPGQSCRFICGDLNGCKKRICFCGKLLP